MKLTTILSLSLALLFNSVDLANSFSFRLLQEEDKNPDNVGDGDELMNSRANIAMMIDNLSFKQPFHSLCVMVSKFDLNLPSEKDDDDDDDDNDNDIFIPKDIFLDNENDDAFKIPGMLWRVSKPASNGLKSLAEDGDCEELYKEMREAHPGDVYIPKDITITPEPSMNEDIDFELLSDRSLVNFTMPLNVDDDKILPPLLFISMVTRLANTNDAFTGFQRFPLLLSKVENNFVLKETILPAYDAGTELNTQMCKDMPAPGCTVNQESNENPQPGEEKVHIHRGLSSTKLVVSNKDPDQTSSTTTTSAASETKTSTTTAAARRRLDEKDTTTTTSMPGFTTTSSSGDDDEKSETTTATTKPSERPCSTTTTSDGTTTTTTANRRALQEEEEEEEEGDIEMDKLVDSIYGWHNPIARVIVGGSWEKVEEQEEDDDN